MLAGKPSVSRILKPGEPWRESPFPVSFPQEEISLNISGLLLPPPLPTLPTFPHYTPPTPPHPHKDGMWHLVCNTWSLAMAVIPHSRPCGANLLKILQTGNSLYLSTSVRSGGLVASVCSADSNVLSDEFFQNLYRKSEILFGYHPKLPQPT